MAISPEKDFNPPSTLPPVYDHTDSPEKTLLPHLRPNLPYTMPLYRRIQFGHLSPHAHILATIPIPNQQENGAPATDGANDAPAAACFAAAYVDRSHRPETECWIYLSQDDPAHAAPTACTCKESHLPALLAHVSTLPYPALPPAQLADVWAAVRAAGAAETAARHHAHTAAPAARYLENLDRPALLKVGAMHAGGVEWARARGWLDGDGVGSLFAYRKYLFRHGSGGGGGKGGEGPALPEGLRWGQIKSDADIALVRSRTAIPKTHATLRRLPSVAVFPEEEGGEAAGPVAWVFLGVEGNLSTLHVEPEYRGRGLAKAIGMKLLRESVSAFGEELGGLAHADVALENKESNGVCKSLGGIDEGWHVYWVRIDLDRVRAQVDGTQ